MSLAAMASVRDTVADAKFHAKTLEEWEESRRAKWIPEDDRPFKQVVVALWPVGDACFV